MEITVEKIEPSLAIELNPPSTTIEFLPGNKATVAMVRIRGRVMGGETSESIFLWPDTARELAIQILKHLPDAA